ncbi:hypothetical protein INR49_010332 [Caranx melampygus]|nr:hypothetical protein INR49_010332 [Caranx melampygus]
MSCAQLIGVALGAAGWSSAFRGNFESSKRSRRERERDRETGADDPPVIITASGRASAGGGATASNSDLMHQNEVKQSVYLTPLDEKVPSSSDEISSVEAGLVLRGHKLALSSQLGPVDGLGPLDDDAFVTQNIAHFFNLSNSFLQVVRRKRLASVLLCRDVSIQSQCRGFMVQISEAGGGGGGGGRVISGQNKDNTEDSGYTRCRTRTRTRTRMEVFLLSVVLASVLITPVLLRTFCPYVWMDILYFGDLLRILVRFVSRRRRRPLFFVLDRFLEQTAALPHKAFVVFEEETFTYSHTDKRSNKVANALRAQPGYTAGDTVALFMGNEPAFLFTWLGLAKLGSPVALLNHNIRSKSLLHCFSCCGASVLIAASELKEAVEDVLPSLTQQGVTVLLMTKHCDTPGIQSFSDKVDAASDAPLPRSLRSHITFKSPAVYIYTSGTTGLPKAAVVNQNRLLTALAVLSSNGVTPGDVIYVNLPLYHTAGFIIGFIGSIETGSTIILKRKFSASQFWDDCRRHSVTVIQYIGEVMRYLCSSPQRENDREHKVRLAIGNGVRADVWREFLRRFGNIQVREFYASTEGNVGFLNYAGKIGAIGRVNFFHRTLFPYTLVKYDTERDEPVRGADGLCVEALTGETGLLVSKITDIAPFVGYAQSEEQTERKRLRNVLKRGDMYFNSGDLMRIDEDNFIYFQDRVGDTFRWKGENVATTEVSDILSLSECLKEANVYGVQVPGHEGRIGMAAVTVKEGAQFDGSRIYDHVVSYLPSYARPRFIRIQDTVELTATFKQMKVKLVEEGFDPGRIQEPVFILDNQEKSYVPLTTQVFCSITSGNIKL